MLNIKILFCNYRKNTIFVADIRYIIIRGVTNLK